MTIDERLLYPVYIVKAIKLMGLPDMAPAHVTLLSLISQGYITTRQLLQATNELECAPRHYAHLSAAIRQLAAHNLIHVDNTIIPSFRGHEHAVLSLKLDGYTYLSGLNRKILLISKMKQDAKIKPYSRRGIT